MLVCYRQVTRQRPTRRPRVACESGQDYPHDQRNPFGALEAHVASSLIGSGETRINYLEHEFFFSAKETRAGTRDFRGATDVKHPSC